MGLINDKIQDKIEYNNRFPSSDVCGVITEVDTFRNVASIRFANPNNGAVTTVDNVKLPVNVGGVTESGVEPGQRCWITFLGGSILHPVISSLSDELYFDNIYSKKTNSDQGGFVVDEYINTLDSETETTPMTDDYFVDAPTDIFSLIGRDYTELDALDATKKSIIQLDKYKDTEDGVSNKKTSSTIKFKENGDIDAFIKANVGIRWSRFRLHSYCLEMFNWGKNMTNNFTEDITNNSKNLTNNQVEDITNNSENMYNNQRNKIVNNSKWLTNNTEKTIESNAENMVNNIKETLTNNAKNIVNNAKEKITNKAKNLLNDIKEKITTKAKEMLIDVIRDITINCRNLIINCGKIIYNGVTLTSEDLQRLLDLLDLDWDAIKELIRMYREGYFDKINEEYKTEEDLIELLQYDTSKIQSIVNRLRRISRTKNQANQVQSLINEYNQIKQDFEDGNVSASDRPNVYERANELVTIFRQEIQDYENA